MSSKKAVGRTRAIVEVAAKVRPPLPLRPPVLLPENPTLGLRLQKSRDPRFDSLSGPVNPTLFRASYGFLREQQTSELAALRQTAKAARTNPAVSEEDAEKVEAALRRMESREVERTRRERDEGALRGWKKDERGKREEGKKGFWLKKGASSIRGISGARPTS